MEGKTVSGVMLSLLLASIVSITLTGLPLADAYPSTVLSVEPTNIADPELSPGSIFRINITVADVQQLHGFQFALSYDTSVLTSVGYGLYLPFTVLMPSEINDEAGYVALAAITYFGDWYGLTTIDATPIAWVEFNVDDRGVSDLDLHGPWEYPGGPEFKPTSILSDVYGEEIDHVDVDGYFDNRIIMATVSIAPDTLNLRSRGQWITAYIQLPEDYNPEEIDVNTILLNETMQPVLDAKYDFVTISSEYLVDHNNDGILERMVEFDRAQVESWIYNTQGISHGDVALTITGKLYDGSPFEGSDTIRVTYPGDANSDGIVNIVDLSIVSAHWYPGPPAGPLGYDSETDFNGDGVVNMLEVSIVSAYWTGSPKGPLAP